MDSVLVIMAAVLVVGWGVWWWLIRAHLEHTAALSRKVEELERKHESR